jgi:ABC-type spermidine/putrescine transport system permease subunit II
MWWIFAAIGAILAQIVMFLRVWAVPVLLFLFVPIAIICLYAFNKPNVQSRPLSGLSTKWISVAWKDSEVRSALVLSLKVVRDDHRVLRLGQQLPEVNVVVVALLIFTVIPVYFAARLTGSGAVSRGSTSALLTAA